MTTTNYAPKTAYKLQRITEVYCIQKMKFYTKNLKLQIKNKTGFRNTSLSRIP